MRPWIWFYLIILILLAGGALQAQPAEPTPLPLYALPESRLRAYSNNTLALTTDGRTLLAANMLNGTLSFMDVVIPNTARLLAEIEVGQDPRSVALTPDNTLALVVLRGENSLAVVDMAARTVINRVSLGGALPYAVVTDRNDRAYVSLQGSNQIAIVDLAAGTVSDYIAVGDFPAGLTLWSEFLYVTHFWSGQVTLIYVPQNRVIETVSLGPDVGLSQAMEIDITRGVAYLPQTRSNAQNISPLFDTTVFPVVNVLDLRSMSVLTEQRIALSLVDRPVNMPFSVVVDRFRNWLYVANAGSNDVSVIDLGTGQTRANIPVRANPRGILLNRDSSFLFVHNVVDSTLSIIDTNRAAVVDVMPISDPRVSTEVLIGAELFHSAADSRMSASHWLSCATCHFDGLSDGRTWQGFPDGPRNTPVLFNLIETAPYTWSAAWDELHDVEVYKIRQLMAGSGLVEDYDPQPIDGAPNANLSFELDLLVSYMLSLPAPANPSQLDAALIAQGQQIFEAQGCSECHVGAAGTDLRLHDVGTGASVDTPVLRYLWLSAPYLHDGSAQTLEDVFTMPGEHNLLSEISMSELEALTTYLLSWP